MVRNAIAIAPQLLRAAFRRGDPALYVIWAAAQTLASARAFYGYMLKQTNGEWSAPLDDVFIHFDYARATALGHPFEWTVGNGYSSGNTSLTYPFVLAAGWLVGFTGRRLMIWAALVAMMCVFGTLLAARSLFIESEHDDWGKLSSYLLPPALLGVGALVWSLWSGMEVSFFLATWALALVAWRRLEQGKPSRAPLHAWWLGLAGALLVLTRPEGAFTVAIFGFAAALTHRRHGKALGILVRAGLPAFVVLALQSIANKALTGEWSANGAVVKLALNNPYMTAADKLDDYVGNLKYAALRNLDYHFAHIEGERMSALLDAPAADEPIKALLFSAARATHLDAALDATRATPLFTYLARTAWWAGMIPLAIATLPLLFVRTRRVAIILWAQIVMWVAVVALNGQVRWQNERYVMPAVAWLMILVALGVSVGLRRRAKVHGRGGPARPAIATTIVAGALLVQVIGVLTRPAGTLPTFRLSWLLALAGGALGLLLVRSWRARAFVITAATLFAYDHQIPKMRDQKWFFGRASRNIRDQHLTLGRYLAELRPHRVLVGDAGAILYESDRPGLDIIGLGGFRGLPFARAGVHGLPATLELIERIPETDRPDVLAIFPTWWGVLPIWFSSEVMQRFPVEGNVICGGYEHIVYRADWRLLGSGERIRNLPAGSTRIRAELDVADLVSEHAHGYAFERPSNGWTEMRILADPVDPKRDLFDGGRRIAVGKSEGWIARGAAKGAPAHLVVRTAPESATHVRVKVGGTEIGSFDLQRTLGWIEVDVPIPPERVDDEMRLELINDGPGDFVDYHQWLTQ
ncbi:MAG: hypothetical protein KF819_25130 [Labilithrix sp.]|nr:hypothetical protein [Labilithrix sp.]